MTLRVGFVEYINSYPLNAAFRKGILSPEATLTYEVPSRLNTLLRSEELDMSFVSAAEYFAGNHLLVPGFGIYAKRSILSVNFYIQRELKDLDGASVGLTPESATSASLLTIFCHHFWNVTPHFELLDPAKSLTDYEGFLFIGDTALKRQAIPGFKTMDLAEAWYQETGLPCVFAVLATRQQVVEKNPKEIDRFTTKLAQALDWGEKNQAVVEAMAKEKCLLPDNVIRAYYSVCCYRLEAEAKRGLELFGELYRHVCSRDS